MRQTLLAGVLIAGAWAGTAHAADASLGDRLTLTSYAGTLGPGLELGMRFNEQWGVRASINAFQTTYVYHDRKSDVHSQPSLLSAGLTADYYPYAGDFRLSAGARLSASHIDGRMKNLRGYVGKGSNRFFVIIPDPLTTYRVEQNAIQPYLGAGYQVKLQDNVSLDFDLGLLYAGTPQLDVDSKAYRFGFTPKQIRNEIERSRDRIAPFKVYPVVQVGLKFAF